MFFSIRWAFAPPGGQRGSRWAMMGSMHSSTRWALVLLGLNLASPATAQPSPTPQVPLHTQEVQRPSMLVGVVAASRSLDLVSPGEGRLEQLKVRLGDHVAAGQVVAQLELRTRQLELASRQAQLKAAEAEHSRFAILLQQAQQQLEREKRIRSFSAAENLERAENAVALAGADVALARARLDAAQAEASLANENLEQARIRAPFAGVVSERYLQPGMTVSRGTPILRLVAEERVLRFAIPEALVPSVRPGTPLRIWVQGASLLNGSVERISPELDLSSRHVKAEARLDVPEALRTRVPVGSMVQVELLPAPDARAAGSPR
jgi:RND family efflux transporter MFP subunit